MSDLNDEALLRRAKHASRNLTVLALLTTLGALVMIGLSFAAKTVPVFTGLLGGIFVVIAAGYWALASAARRGNPNAVGIVLVLVVVQIGLNMIISGIAASRSGSPFHPNTPALVIPILVFVALYSSRQVLLELEDRGLMERAFASAKPSRNLCITGGILLVAGFIGLDAGLIYSGQTVARERAEGARNAQAFARLVKVDELEFMTAMDGIWRWNGPLQVQAARAKLDGLERSLEALKKASTADATLLPIISNYEKALQEWRKGLAMLQNGDLENERVHAMFKLGDQFRATACEDFNRQFLARR